MRSRRTIASVTPVTGFEPQDLRHRAGAGLVDAQPVRDELERDHDEPPGAFHQERINESGPPAAGQQPEHQPHLGDGGDMERGLPRQDPADPADRPLQHAVDPRFDFADRVGGHGRLAGEPADERRQPRQDCRLRSRHPQAHDANNRTADDDDLGDVLQGGRDLGALKEQPGAGEQHHSDRGDVERVFDRDRRDARDRRDPRARHQDLRRLAGQQPKRCQIPDRIRGENRPERLTESERPAA